MSTWDQQEKRKEIPILNFGAGSFMPINYYSGITETVETAVYILNSWGSESMCKNIIREKVLIDQLKLSVSTLENEDKSTLRAVALSSNLRISDFCLPFYDI